MRGESAKLARLARHHFRRVSGDGTAASGRRRVTPSNGILHARVFEPNPGIAAPSVVLVAASLDLLGGQGMQAQVLADNLRAENMRVKLLPVNPTFPPSLRWLRRVPYLRTVVNQILYLPSLAVLRKADIVHVFSASYFSFLLGPATGAKARTHSPGPSGRLPVSHSSSCRQ